MSNQQVGIVYDRVIREVCDASQVDFEEGGVDQQTLEDLKKGWKQKLSTLGVATFPWDPPPQPQHTATAHHAPTPGIPPPMVTVPSNVPPVTSPPPLTTTATTTAPTAASFSPAPAQPPFSDARVKPEPGYGTSGMGSIPSTGMPQSVNTAQLAQQRAAQALHQKFGMAAAPQIQQLQAQSQSQGGPIPAQTQAQAHSAFSQFPGQNTRPMPYTNSSHQPLPVADHRQNSTFQQYASQHPHQSHAQPQQHRPSVANGQTDGAGDEGTVDYTSPISFSASATGNPLSDWKELVARRRAEATRHPPGVADRLLRDYIMSQARAMEGNGLLVPFGEQEYGMRGKSGSSANGTKRAVRATRFRSDRDVFGEKAPMPGSLVAKRAHKVPPPFDGPNDRDGSKEDDDEDAINSDLDDPEDPLDDEDNGDESVGQVMLCTYDKVQRVKSKWKCTLKDGILSTNGREYVFHKGQGEFEW